MSGVEFVTALDRQVRRAAAARALRRWPAWVWQDVPNGVPGSTGWAREVRRVAANGLFSVLIRPLPDGAEHAMIATLCGAAPPTWAEKQRIKDTLFGARWAVECFPPRDRLIDAAEAYHLWVLSKDAAWPYDLAAGEAHGPG